MDWNLFGQLVGNISGVLGIVSFFLSVFIAWQVRNKKDRLHRMLQGRIPSGQNGILIVDSTDLSPMEEQVMNFCKDDPILCNVGKEFIGIVNYGLIVEHEKDIETIFKLFHKEHEKLLRNGVVHIHFFFRGPSMLGAMIGARLSNCPDITCYQMSRTSGKYENWGTVRRSVVS